MTVGLSWFRPGPYVQQWCARGTVLLRTVVLVEGGYKRGGRGGLASMSQRYWLRHVPISWRRRRACGWLLSVVPCPLRLEDCPSFYRPRREQFTCVPHYFPMCGGMASSATELTAVLANPPPAGASWCVLCSYRSGFEGGGVVVGRPAAVRGPIRGCRWRGVRTWHSGSCGDVLSPRTPTTSGCRHNARCGEAVAGMVAQGWQRRGWPIPPAWHHGVALCNHRKGIRGCCRPPFEGSTR
jgi:hypothetical protein